jgi:hypothetical protein
MTRRPSATEAQRLADVHLVDRYDRAQLTALDRLDQLDRAATPLVVPRGVNRVYRTESTGHRARLTVVGPEFRVTRDTVLTLLDLGLAHCDHVARLNSGQHHGRAGDGTAYVLTATRQGRDVLEVARRLGRLPERHGSRSSR